MSDSTHPRPAKMELAESTGCSVYGTVTVVRIGSMIVAVGIPEHTVVDARKQKIGRAHV